MNLPWIDLFLLLEQFPNSTGKGIKVIKIVQNLASIFLDPEKIKHQHHFAVSFFFWSLQALSRAFFSGQLLIIIQNT